MHIHRETTGETGRKTKGHGVICSILKYYVKIKEQYSEVMNYWKCSRNDGGKSAQLNAA